MNWRGRVTERSEDGLTTAARFEVPEFQTWGLRRGRGRLGPPGLGRVPRVRALARGRRSLAAARLGPGPRCAVVEAATSRNGPHCAARREPVVSPHGNPSRDRYRGHVHRPRRGRRRERYVVVAKVPSNAENPVAAISGGARRPPVSTRRTSRSSSSPPRSASTPCSPARAHVSSSDDEGVRGHPVHPANLPQVPLRLPLAQAPAAARPADCLGVAERLDEEGNELAPLDADELERLVAAG